MTAIALDAATPAARFQAGDRVRVQLRDPPGHVRTPRYLRGKHGVVLRALGAFAFPEELAYGRPGLPRQTLYMVRFALGEVWAGRAAETTGADPAFAPGDTLTADIYESWLDPDPGDLGTA